MNKKKRAADLVFKKIYKNYEVSQKINEKICNAKLITIHFNKHVLRCRSDSTSENVFVEMHTNPDDRIPSFIFKLITIARS